MRCETAREAVSALLDGEPPAVPAGRLRDHLEQCPHCATWRSLADYAAIAEPTIGERTHFLPDNTTVPVAIHEGAPADATFSGCRPAGSLAEAVAAQQLPPARTRTRTAPARYGTGTKVVHAALASEVCLLVTASGLPAGALAIALPATLGVSVTVQQAVARRAARRELPVESELSLTLPPRAVPGRRRPYAAPAGKSTP
ncbi:zf-HC2 domain-containing protein [Nocardia flavorosea]|uniref:Zf-HC2 domain-containing protein n=1 Tax=Nocardia flavorosea TaxID=53429 RepID=A0A846YGQ3_9NOCA|nr:zf-HC2 domain-containing protein [Nocardia flavorosea]NKY57011.1 zf-HC2 domain-containing protein [Nocardia flavorosea]